MDLAPASRAALLSSLLSALVAAGCTGPRGEPGPAGSDATSPWSTGKGLAVTGLSLSAAPGAAALEFTVTDDVDGDPATSGTPLDPAGLLTAGPVTIQALLAEVDGDDASPGRAAPWSTALVGGALQAAWDEGGTLEAIDLRSGRYRYVFGAALTALDANRTQVALLTARRTLDGVTYRARATGSVHPGGGAVAVRDVAPTARCAACHGRLAVHAEAFDEVGQCVLCHVPGTSDPESGNTLELGGLLHRIHRGADLPSVVAGTPLAYVGAAGARDYSTVRHPQSIERCEGCHGGAAQGTAWRDRPTTGNCAGCHDTTSFEASPPAGAVAHSGGDQPDDSLCASCHPATGGTSPCAGEPCSVTAAHVDPSFDPAAPALTITIDSATSAGPGQPLVIGFTVSVDGAPLNILVAPLAALRATMAGPNEGFTTMMTVGTSTNPFATVTIQGSGATGTLTAVDAANGTFSYTFPVTVAVPASASGSWTVGIEGYLQASPSEPRWLARSPTKAFAVTDPSPVPRRTIVDPAKCDACHLRLTGHSTRVGADSCTLCHGPANANNDRVSRFEGTTVLAESVDLKVMIHRIHTGSGLSRPYRLGGSPTPTVGNPGGTMIDFGQTRYPRDPADCAACHADPAPGTSPSWALPLAARAPSLLQELTCTEDPSDDADAYCDSPFWNVTTTLLVPPETAACTGCHDAPYVAVHAELASTPAGDESCATCHGPGASWDVEAVHRR